MTLSELSDTFAGYPVVNWWQPDKTDFSCTAIRLAVDYDASEAGVIWTDLFFEFLEQPGAEQLKALVIGAWEDMSTGTAPDRIVEALVDAKDNLPNLRAIFFGDITYEESEISWIVQGDVSALFTAYPQLEHFCVRGGNNLNLGTLNHANLKSLTIQTGGLNREVVAQVCRAELPALEHLELWLGVEEYGGDCELDDLRPLFQLRKFPALKYLGLKDSMLADAIAEAVADAPVLEQLEVLDLSMGVLGDAGAEKLISSPAIKKLKNLVLRHHYMSDAMVRRWSTSGITADVSDQQKAADVDDRYVEVSE